MTIGTTSLYISLSYEVLATELRTYANGSRGCRFQASYFFVLKLDSAKAAGDTFESLISKIINYLHIISLSNFQIMNKFLSRALPVTAVIVDVLLIVDITKDLVKEYRKKHPSTTTTTQDEAPEDTAPEPTTT